MGPTQGTGASTSGIAQITSTGGTVTVTNPTGPIVNLEVAPAGTIDVATYTALGALASASLTQGTAAFVNSGKALFLLIASTAAVRTNVRIAASGKTGFQWARVVVRNPVWEVQATWNIDPTNSSGVASDDNSGVNGAAPLLTFNELAVRLASAEIAQVTTITHGPGDQQAGDNPTWTYVCRGQNMNFVGTPTIVYTSTVTGFVAAAVSPTTAADDNELIDAAVPGGSWTAAGALTAGRILKRTNGTVIYAAPLKDLGATTLRTGQPANPASLIALVGFVIGDTYQLLQLPQINSFIFPPNRNIDTSFTNCNWQVPAVANGIVSGLWTACFIGKGWRSVGNNSLGACTISIAGGFSFETGVPPSTTLQMCSFIGTGATLYSFAGFITTEGTVTSLQGCGTLIERGAWNGGQINAYDSSIPAIRSGTCSRWHSVATLNGKGNTGKLIKATDASQVVSTITMGAGTFWTAASTSDANPIQTGGTSGAVAVPLDANMNGVFTTA